MSITTRTSPSYLGVESEDYHFKASLSKYIPRDKDPNFVRGSSMRNTMRATWNLRSQAIRMPPIRVPITGIPFMMTTVESMNRG
jgi:hypothetical protein